MQRVVQRSRPRWPGLWHARLRPRVAVSLGRFQSAAVRTLVARIPIVGRGDKRYDHSRCSVAFLGQSRDKSGDSVTVVPVYERADAGVRGALLSPTLRPSGIPMPGPGRRWWWHWDWVHLHESLQRESGKPKRREARSRGWIQSEACRPGLISHSVNSIPTSAIASTCTRPPMRPTRTWNTIALCSCRYVNV